MVRLARGEAAPIAPSQLIDVPGSECVEILEAEATTADVHRILSRLPPIEVVFDDWGGDEAARRDRWNALFPHLAHGGRYVTRFTGGWIDALVRGGGSDHIDGVGRDQLSCVSAARECGEWAVLEKRHDHLLKLRGDDVDELIAAREPNIEARLLVTRPGGWFTARDTVIHHESDVPISWPDRRVPYPDLEVRHYTGAIAYGGHALSHGQRTILPEAYRWHLAADPSNPETVNTTPDFARLKQPSVLTDVDAPTLDGDFYQIEPQHPGYGHVLTETVGRLWGWGPAKEALPGLKALAYVYRHPDRARTTPKYDILRAYGIADDDIVFTDRPVRLRSLIGATDMWHNNQPYSVHPDLPTVWRRIAEGLPRPDAPQFDRIFVGRGSKYRRRTCRNASAVEQLFADHGYEIIYPEKWTLPQQAQIFGRSRVIAGFGGSGLFNMLFAQRLEAMIILNQDSYYHRNEHLFTALLGPEVHYFWSAADLPQDASGQNLQASESDWDFDMSRHGPELRSLLRRLS